MIKQIVLVVCCCCMMSAFAQKSNLINCPDCDARISKRAKSCPQCGCPNTSDTNVSQNSSSSEQNKFKQVKEKLVLIENATGSGMGSGFIATYEGKPWLFTNEHVARMGSELICKTIDGRVISINSDTCIHVAKNTDLVRFPVPSDMPSLTWFSGVPNIGESVWVYGNSDGGGVVTELKGKVLGIASSIIEVDAKFVEGNSGGPILNSAGEILGVATYATNDNEPEKWIKKGTRFNEIRRYGVRVVNCEWEGVSWGVYSAHTTGIYLLRESIRLISNIWNNTKEDYLYSEPPLDKSSVKALENTVLPGRLKKKLRQIAEGDELFFKEANAYIDARENYEKAQSVNRKMIEIGLREYDSKRRRVINEVFRYSKISDIAKLAAEVHLLEREELRYQGLELVAAILKVENWPTEKLKAEAEGLRDVILKFLKGIKEFRKKDQETIRTKRSSLRMKRS